MMPYGVKLMRGDHGVRRLMIRAKMSLVYKAIDR